jgi:hypothetical protein
MEYSATAPFEFAVENSKPYQHSEFRHRNESKYFRKAKQLLRYLAIRSETDYDEMAAA